MAAPLLELDDPPLVLLPPPLMLPTPLGLAVLLQTKVLPWRTGALPWWRGVNFLHEDEIWLLVDWRLNVPLTFSMLGRETLRHVSTVTSDSTIRKTLTS